MKRNFLKPVLLFLPVIVLASCNIEENEGKIPVSKNSVVFTIGGDEVLTKAAYAAPVMEPISLVGENGELEGWVLTETITSMDDGLYDIPEEGPETKGTLITDSNFNSVYGVKEMVIRMFNPSNMKAFDAKYTLTSLGNNKYAIEFEDGVRWPEPDCQLLFFIEAPKSHLNNLESEWNYYSTGKIQFDYETPIDVDDQVDMLFGSILIGEKTKQDNNVVDLYHVLTGVKFEIATDDGYYKKNGVDIVPPTINKITILDLNNAGYCTIDPSLADSSAEQGQSPVVSTWKNTNGEVEYYVEGNGITMLLTPQEVSGKTVQIDFTIEGQPYSRTVKLPENMFWKAGELHTYTLGITKVNVDVTDKMNSDLTQKTDVLTWNNGNAAEYVRAT